VRKIGSALGLSVRDAALGIYNIVNENMVGALRLVSVEQGHDPREYALIAFGGAGPLHANALARLLGSWPAIIPPGPGVLCALGDATTAIRDESARTYICKFSDTNARDVSKVLSELADDAARSLEGEQVPRSEMSIGYQVDVRYRGQGLLLTVNIELEALAKHGLKAISVPFDAEHKRLFTFALPLEHELVNLRATVQGRGISIERPVVAKGGPSPKAAAIGKQKAYMDGREVSATVYERGKFRAGNRIAGPAVIMEMDSTAVILPRHTGVVDRHGNILIYPDGYRAPKKAKVAGKTKARPKAKVKVKVKARSRRR
jgi:N-methylhydantoinase A